jgi:hypothetical protein
VRAFRILFLVTVLCGLVWATVIKASGRDVAATALDLFDRRPARAILFIGNSRTYPFDMPFMVREMADSAGAAEKYQIRMYALPGRSLRDHWQDPEVQELLAQKWDDVVLQERSAGHYPSVSNEFHNYGTLLVRAIAEKGGRPLMFVGWNYSAGMFAEAQPGSQSAYYQMIQSDHLRLSRETGARLANVGQVWQSVLNANPPFRLETDGNHPTLHGSYLTALVIYAELSGKGIADVTYRPDDLSEADAKLLRDLATASLPY